MKNKLLRLISVLLCFAMLGAAFAVAIPASRITSVQIPNAGQNGLNTSELTTQASSTPIGIWDFTTADADKNLSGTTQTTATIATGSHTNFAATGVMSNVSLDTSLLTAAAPYVAIGYRTSVFAGAKIDLAISSTATSYSASTCTTYSSALTVDGQWHTAVVDTTGGTNFDGETVSFLRMKFTGSKNGSIDISYVAFFATQEAAEAFDLAVYKSGWTIPTYQEMTTTSADYNTDSVVYTPSADGTQMTISYKLNDQTVSYTVPNNKNYLSGGFAGVDDLGRELYDSEDVGVYGSKGERYVGLFYFLLHGEAESGGNNISKVYNLQYILDTAANPQDVANYGDQGISKWFAEPLYGYYTGGDTWVMRKHAELLCNANIDFLFFDATNGFDYSHNAIAMMEILLEMSNQGYDAPQVLFYTNTNSASLVAEIYTDVYQARPDLSSTWFRLDGKPVIVATGVTNATHTNFFNIKTSQWPTQSSKTNGWPWMDFNANGVAQSVIAGSDGRDAISVSAAQHHATICISESSLFGGSDRGRSYSPSLYSSISAYRTAWSANQNLTKNGANFQWQWDNAHNTDAEIVLVTGWNEWIADLKYPTGQNGGLGEYAYAQHAPAFVDCASMEYSRDLEMMAFYDPDGDGNDNGYFDNYYMQLVQNVEKRKGDAPVIVQDLMMPINVTGEFDQWDNVKVSYYDMAGDIADRSHPGFGGTTYKNTSGRNDIVASKVTADSKNLYFYVETAENIVYDNYKGAWMQLYVDIDSNVKTGWYGYDYIINYNRTTDLRTTVYKYNGTDNTTYDFVKTGDINYRVLDNHMMLEVPKAMVGASSSDNALNFQFKWVDSETAVTSMQAFYTEGDTAPLGRLNYIYQNYIPGKSTPPAPAPDETLYEYPIDNSAPNTTTNAPSSYNICTDGFAIDGTWQVESVANTYLNSLNNTITDSTASYTTLAFYGWLNTGSSNISAFGYELNGVKYWSTSKLYAYSVDDGADGKITVTAANCTNNIAPDSGLSNSHTNAKRHLVEINVGNLDAGIYNISILVELSDGTIYDMSTWPTISYIKYAVAGSGAGSETETETETETVTETETDPVTETETETEIIVCTDGFAIDGTWGTETQAYNYLAGMNNTITDSSAAFKALAFYGWANTNAENIIAFGYELNGVQNWSTSKLYAYSVDDGAGGKITVTADNCADNIAPNSGLSAFYSSAKRHLIEVPVGDLTAGTYTIKLLIKLNDGTIAIMPTWPTITYVKDAAVTPDPGASDSLTNATTAQTGAASHSWRYAGQLLTVNGLAINAGLGYRDNSSTASPKPIYASTFDASSLSTSTLTLSGWALSRLGQDQIVWSLDGNTWYACSTITYGTATADQLAIAEAAPSSVTGANTTNGAFSGLTLNLASKAGETVNVYLAVLPSGNSSYICHFATIENWTIPAATDPSATINSAAVTLGTDLSITFYATLPTTPLAQGIWAIRVVMNDKTTYIPVSNAILSNSSTNEYAFTYEGITPQTMGDTLNVDLVVYDQSANNVISVAHVLNGGYSVKTNLINLLSTYPNDTSMKQLIHSVLNYGAAAQFYIGYKSDNLVNADVDTSSACTETPVASDNVFTLGASTGATTYFKSAAVYYGNGVNRLSFKFISDTANATVKINGITYTATANGNVYTVLSDALTAKQFGNTYTVELVVNGTTVQTLTYSVNSYAYRVITAGNTTDANEALALALYRYGVAAMAYNP